MALVSFHVRDRRFVSRGLGRNWDETVSLMGYLGMKAFDRIASTSLELSYLGYGLVLLHRPARVCRSPTGALRVMAVDVLR